MDKLELNINYLRKNSLKQVIASILKLLQNVGSYTSTSVTETILLNKSSWNLVNNVYQYTVIDNAINSGSWISSVFKNSDTNVVNTAQIQSQLIVSDGQFIIEALSIPTTDLNLSYRIFEGGTTGGGTVSVSSSDVIEISDNYIQEIYNYIDSNSNKITEISDCDLAIIPGQYSLVGGDKLHTPDNLQNDAALFVFSNHTDNSQQNSIGQLYVAASGKLWYRSNYDDSGFTDWKSFVTLEDLENINTTVNHDLTLLGDGTTNNPLSVRMLELPMQTVVNGAVIIENPYYVYKIATATDLTVTLDTSHVDLSQYIKFYLKINLNDYKTLTFPSNWYFANLDTPNLVGEYLYEVTSSDNGATWRLQIRYENIASVGIDQNGNEIVGSKLLYVDGLNGLDTNNGLTWATAYKNIQVAIDASNAGDAIFVKGSLTGIKYLPTTLRTAGDNRSKSFIMKTGVNVYGGFAGTEKTLYEREMVSYQQDLKLPNGTQTIYIDQPKYKSILSGEISGESVIDSNISIGNRFTTASIASNSYNVVYSDVAGNTTLNGFDIQGGNANNSASSVYQSGAGIYSLNKSLLVSNCFLHDNYSSVSGGGAYNATIINSILKYCSSQGSGAAANSCSNTKCIIANNKITSYGGGGGTSNGTNINCFIGYNIATTLNYVYGGASYQDNNTNCCIAYNVLSGVSQLMGAGARACMNINCSIYSNSFSGSNNQYGGGTEESTNICCKIYNNVSTNLGGGTSDGTNINCSIHNNSATSGGGTYQSTNINSTIVRNTCSSYGGGTYNSPNKNTVVWGNKFTTGTTSNVYNSNSSVEEYSAFENEIRTGTGNISLSINNTGDANSPYFTTVSTDAGVVDEQYACTLTLSSSNSALKNAGLDSDNNSGYGSIYDIKSQPRKVGTIDIGCFELQN